MTVLVLKNQVNYFNLTPATTGLNTASVYIGRILGLAVSGYCTDKFGRRPTIFIGSAITIVGIILQGAAQNMFVYFVFSCEEIR